MVIYRMLGYFVLVPFLLNHLHDSLHHHHHRRVALAEVTPIRSDYSDRSTPSRATEEMVEKKTSFVFRCQNLRTRVTVTEYISSRLADTDWKALSIKLHHSRVPMRVCVYAISWHGITFGPNTGGRCCPRSVSGGIIKTHTRALDLDNSGNDDDDGERECQNRVCWKWNKADPPGGTVITNRPPPQSRNNGTTSFHFRSIDENRYCQQKRLVDLCEGNRSVRVCFGFDCYIISFVMLLWTFYAVLWFTVGMNSYKTV